MTRAAPVVLLAALSVPVSASAAAPADAQEDARYEAAKRAAAEALVLEKQGRSDDARRLLEDSIVSCGEGAESARCRLHLRFTMAYISEQRAEIEEAIAHYEAILREVPSHGPTLNNLALIESGRGDLGAARRHWVRAVEEDPERAGRYLLRMGESLLASGDAAGALGSFRRAAAMSPEDGAPLRRIIQVHEHATQPGPAEMIELAASWEVLHPEEAGLAYEAVMLAGPPIEGGPAERALLSWISLSASMGWLTPERVASLQQRWLHPALEAMERYLKAPTEPIQSIGWWNKGPLWAEAFGQACLTAGEALVLDGDTKGAATAWETGLNAMQLPTMPRPEVQARLAMLYSREPGLDPDGTRFRRLLDDIYILKGGSYRSGDLPAIRRYHTVLGLILAERDEWGHEGDPRSALFQLRHAIDTTGKLSDLDGVHEPVPHLRALLADGYDAKGRKADARAERLRAAQDYLDLDDLDAAGRALDRAGPPGTDSGAGASDPEPALREILKSRRAAASAGPAPDLMPWLEGPAPAALPKSFVERQRFKVLSDRAINRDPAGALPDAIDAYLKVAEGGASLVGTQDLSRFKRIESIVAGSVGFASRAAREAPSMTAGQGGAPAKPGERVGLYVTRGKARRTVTIPPDNLLAARVAREARAQGIAGRMRISLRDGVISIDEAPPGTDVERFAGALRQVEGVADVRLKRRR